MKIDKIVLVILIACLIGGFILIQFGSKKSIKEREFLAFNGGFAIGAFESRNMSNSSTYSISFNYSVNSKEYHGGDTRCFEDSSEAADAFTNKDKAKPGDKFLVLYNNEKPKKSIIRLDYPIRDSSDFKRYVKEFKQMRKQKEIE